jgi:hypothetical protein
MNPSAQNSVQLNEASILRANLVASQGAIKSLTENLAYAEMQISALTKERDELKAKFPPEKSDAKK